jgi:hypothetical protein
MERLEVAHQCATISTTFLLNRVGDDIIQIRRAILCSYRYHLETEVSKNIVCIAESARFFRSFVLFKNVHGEHLSDAQRQTVPLTKLIYFYLSDHRRISVVNFSIIYPRE